MDKRDVPTQGKFDHTESIVFMAHVFRKVQGELGKITLTAEERTALRTALDKAQLERFRDYVRPPRQLSLLRNGFDAKKLLVAFVQTELDHLFGLDQLAFTNRIIGSLQSYLERMDTSGIDY
jgi:hypothetical protein